MGLIKAAKEAIKGTMTDQWKEAIRCENMTNDVLMVKKTTPTGVITNKSTIIVAPGQCAVIFDNGRIIDATAEDGFYTFDESSSPSFFAGQFGAVFKEMWQRFTYNGGTAKEQAVYFFNIKEIVDNKFGTASPIPFQVIAVFQNVVNELGNSKYKVPVLEMPSQTDEIREMMDEKVFDEKIRERGLKIESFAVESVTLDEESEKKIDDYELSSNAYMQQGKMVDAYSEAVKNAAKNESGALNGFMGVGVMNMATGNVMGNAVANPWQDTQKSTIDLSKQEEQKVEEPVKETTEVVTEEPKQEVKSTWTCQCGKENEGNFCSNCGSKKPKACKKCNGKF